MGKYDSVVVGGGAAGICAAIASARLGAKVAVCDRMPQLGKKILSTGNGRCNLLNEDLDEKHYNAASRNMVKAVFNQFGKNELLDFFHGLGLLTCSRDGRIFPVTNQASSVLKVLDMELKRLGVQVELEFDCSSISFIKSSILVSAADKRHLECSKVVIAGGGKTYPAYGSDGSIFKVIRRLGYSMIEPVPCAVPLVIKNKSCAAFQGQKINVTARWMIDDSAGPITEGELLFTQYGLSGTAILDIGDEISIAINRDKKQGVKIAIDLVPVLNKTELKETLAARYKTGCSASEMLVGILPNRLSLGFKSLFEENDLTAAVNTLKNWELPVSGTRGWNEAEFTAGGIEISQIKPGTLESKIHGGVYFAGEMLDVNGRRGGYNLAWAWASGLVAGGLPKK